MRAHSKIFSVLFVSLLTACAASTRPPVAKAPGATPPAAAADPSEDADGADSDSDADEATAGNGSATEIAIDTTAPGPCPKNMVLVASGEARFCVDKYEASLVEIDADGTEKAYPHWLAVDGHTVRAVSEPNVFPQGFISEVQAEDACAASNKRLCSHVEWKTACMGPAKTTFPYGEARKPGACHDTGKSAVAAVFGYQRLADPTNVPARTTAVSSSTTTTSTSKSGKSERKAHASSGKHAAESSHTRAARPESKSATASVKKKSLKNASSSASSSSSNKKKNESKRSPAKTSTRPASVEPSVWSQLNDPRLGQVDGGLSRTGSHAECVNGFGAVDMVGNLHEWVKTDPSTVHGTFAGGYYLDTSLNGDGCQYKTVAHAHDYHDYSTGFRCCAEPKK